MFVAVFRGLYVRTLWADDPEILVATDDIMISSPSGSTTIVVAKPV
jgi:hypothetical protein